MCLIVDIISFNFIMRYTELRQILYSFQNRSMFLLSKFAMMTIIQLCCTVFEGRLYILILWLNSFSTHVSSTRTKWVHICQTSVPSMSRYECVISRFCQIYFVFWNNELRSIVRTKNDILVISLYVVYCIIWKRSYAIQQR